MTSLHQWKHEARKRRARKRLEQGDRLPKVARATGLSYTTVWRLNEPIRQQQRADRERIAADAEQLRAEQRRQPRDTDVVCRCGRLMLVTQPSVTVEVHQHNDEPDRLWAGSIYTCPDCGQTVITGFARLPIAEQGQASYAEERARRAPLYPARDIPNPHTPKLYVANHAGPQAS